MRMLSDDDIELQEFLEDDSFDSSSPPEPRYAQDVIAVDPDHATEDAKPGASTQWTSPDGKQFFPSGKTANSLPCGVYDVQISPQRGLYFEKVPINVDGLLRFPQTNSEKVINEIQNFWEKEERFKEYNLAHKRGIMLWGPPGSGKSCTIQIIIKDVIDRDGIVIKFGHPGIFTQGIRAIREIQPETPIVVLMEDIDATLQIYSESEVLNVLDGVERIEKVVFLATTNYPDRLGARIINRPSRFDKRFKIGHPDANSREMYFKHIIGGDDKIKELEVDVDRWVEDTEGFSIAHLKELFVAVCILGDDYEDAVETLSSMREAVKGGEEFETKKVGFTTIGNVSQRSS